jgi:peptidoglycan/LPS O-acetylase OafA/YrhL
VRNATARRADIQGLRALAILLVVAYHAGLPIPSGYTGVDVFFAISGFVSPRCSPASSRRQGGYACRASVRGVFAVCSRP